MQLPREVTMMLDGKELKVSSYCLHNLPGKNKLSLEFEVFSSNEDAQDSDECDSCYKACQEECLDKSRDLLRNRPLYVISSSPYPTKEAALEKVKEWFENGNLDQDCAIYRLKDDCCFEGYVISSNEFDTIDEAQDQIYQWHEAGILSSNARIFKTTLADCYELELNLVPAVQ